MGVAKLLSEMPDRPAGQVRFLFQPSEEASDNENKSGAVRMIEDGALDGLDAVIALHVASDLTANKIEIAPEFVTAAEDSFHAVIKGTGGHGAFPHQGIDPTFILAQVINAIQGIRSRRVNPTKAATISLGYIHAGAVTNVIPAEVKLGGTMRSYDDDVRQQLKHELELALGVARSFGGDYELTFSPGYPSTYNDPAVTAMIQDATRAMLGDDGLADPEPGMGAEDFSYMTRKAPGAMFMLGAKFDDKNRPHHTPVFDISEDALPTGAALLADVTVKLLREKA
jgi:amidohydrolase